MELLKHFYFRAQKSITKAVNSKFQDLINAPRIYLTVASILSFENKL